MQSAANPKFSTLKKKEDFERIYNEGKQFAGSRLGIIFINNNYNTNRIAYIAGKKRYPDSYLRNRIRRIMREAYREIDSSVIRGIDIALQARRVDKSTKTKDVAVELLDLLKKAELLA